MSKTLIKFDYGVIFNLYFYKYITAGVMSENSNLDFNILAQKCLIGTESDETKVVELLKELETEYKDIHIIAIYNYFLLIEHRPAVLIFMLKTLDRFRDSSSMEAITRLLLLKEHIEPFDRVDYTEVRVLCARAISNLKSHSAVFALLECLNNKNENYKVRLSCADALGRLGDRYAVAPLIDIVSDESEKSVYIRESAATALGLIGDNRAAESLISILEAKNGIMDKFTYLKERVIEALSKLTPEDDRAFKALKKSLTDENPQIRINAIEAIMNYEHTESSALIKKMLNDENEEVVKNAVIAIYNLEGESALEEILDSKNYSKYCKEETKALLESEKDCENL